MDWMLEALTLAEQGRYTCAPNPMVGCIIVKDGKVVGSGFHQKTGAPHAEQLALGNAGHQAHGADVYVTLEPCCHYGRTPPCADLLIQKNVKNVYIAMEDPNPQVRGQGISRLRAAGINVHIGIHQERAYKLNEVFCYFITQNQPFVNVKWAMSLDGKIAPAQTQTCWITSKEASSHAHELRAQVAGVAVGAGTVRTDNPHLDVRHIVTTHQPRPLIFTTSGHIPATSYLLRQGANTIVLTSNRAPTSFFKLLEDRNIDYLVTPVYQTQLDLTEALKKIAALDISSILVEGGSHLLTHFVQHQLVHRIYAYIGPKIIGGKGSLSPFKDMEGADVTLIPLTTIPLGPDVCMVSDTLPVPRKRQGFLHKKELSDV
jgi:diaminohydroxyphosphoribosylaminopyrimidine deaminase/5-amino-6-(5-phosphoribosylamino)uracil reductase